MALLRANFAKIAALLLLLADLGLAWPLYEKALQNPLEGMEDGVPARSGAIRIRGGEDEDTAAIKAGRPPSRLLTWDPFGKPRSLRPAQSGPEDGGDTEEVIVEVLPIPTDKISLLGIISLNDRYSALVTIGEESLELRKGMLVPDHEDVRCAEIRRNGILLVQPGAAPTFLELKRPELNAAPWYQEADPGAIRGRIEMRR